MDKVVTVKCDSKYGFAQETDYYLSKGYRFVSAGYAPAAFDPRLSSHLVGCYDKPCWWAVMEREEVTE